MLPPGPLLPSAQCRQVASMSRRGGIAVPGAWRGLPERRMAANWVTQELCLVPSLSLSCSGLNITNLGVTPFPLGKMLEVGADYSAHFCAALLVMIRGQGAAGGGYWRMDCRCSLNLFLPGWQDWG